MIKAPKVYFSDNGLVSALLNINSLKALDITAHSGNLWENFVLTELIKEGFIAGKDLFYFRDQNGVDIDFIVENEGLAYLVEAKQNERPNPGRLNFNKIAPLFKGPVSSVLACGIHEEGFIKLKDYFSYNPLFGLGLKDIHL